MINNLCQAVRKPSLEVHDLNGCEWDSVMKQTDKSDASVCTKLSRSYKDGCDQFPHGHDNPCRLLWLGNRRGTQSILETDGSMLAPLSDQIETAHTTLDLRVQVRGGCLKQNLLQDEIDKQDLCAIDGQYAERTSVTNATTASTQCWCPCSAVERSSTVVSQPSLWTRVCGPDASTVDWCYHIAQLTLQDRQEQVTNISVVSNDKKPGTQYTEQLHSRHMDLLASADCMPSACTARLHSGVEAQQDPDMCCRRVRVRDHYQNQDVLGTENRAYNHIGCTSPLSVSCRGRHESAFLGKDDSVAEDIRNGSGNTLHHIATSVIETPSQISCPDPLTNSPAVSDQSLERPQKGQLSHEMILEDGEERSRQTLCNVCNHRSENVKKCGKMVSVRKLWSISVGRRRKKLVIHRTRPAVWRGDRDRTRPAVWRGDRGRTRPAVWRGDRDRTRPAVWRGDRGKSGRQQVLTMLGTLAVSKGCGTVGNSVCQICDKQDVHVDMDTASVNSWAHCVTSSSRAPHQRPHQSPACHKHTSQRHSGSKCPAQISTWRIKKGRSTHAMDKYSIKALMERNASAPRFAGRARSQSVRRVLQCSCRVGQLELLPSYFLNVNSNAGISESGSDGVKPDTKQPSCTSVHSSDQYFSTHTDNPDVKVVDSDLEVSPSFSFMEEGADRQTESSPVINDDDVVNKPVEDEEPKKVNAASTLSDVFKQRRQRKSLEESNPDDCADANCMKHVSDGPATVIAAQDDIHHGANKHNKKTKTTETLYIKFESSVSKKVTCTTLLKDGRKPVTNKSHPELPKQLPPLEDAHKQIVSAPEQLDNKSTLDNPRYTKIIRCNEGHYESTESPIKSSHEAVVKSGAADDSYKTRALQAQAAQFDHTGSPAKTSLYDYQVKQLPSQRYTHKLRSPLDTKLDFFDPGYTSEKESSAATIVNFQNASTCKEANGRRGSWNVSPKSDVIHRTDSNKRNESPKKEFKISQEKKDQPKRTSPVIKDSYGSKVDNKEEQARVETLPAGRHESRRCQTSAWDAITRKKSATRPKGGSPIKRSPHGTISKHEGKKVPSAKGRGRQDLTSKEDDSEPVKVKTQQPLTSAKKRSPARTKTPSRSPEFKRRKRNVKKSNESKSSSSFESSRTEKARKQKGRDKVTDKTKKKKKGKQKGRGDEGSSESLHTTKWGSRASRSRSSESSKTTQTSSCCASAPHFLETTILAEQLSPMSYWRIEDNKPIVMEDKQCGGIDEQESVTPLKEGKSKSRGTSSAENLSTCGAPNKPIRSVESVPTFTGTVYTTLTKLVQVTSCPKVKRNVKDLHQAELGWNSSTMSAEERAAAEKAKPNQKRAKARYYLAKPKPKKVVVEAGGTKLKRTVPRRSQADGDKSARESTDKDDPAQQDRSRPGQGKSVQFSDSTEDHEAFRDDTPTDQIDCQQMPGSDNVPQPSYKLSDEIVKSANKEDIEVAIPSKQKRDEARLQTTPPRKKRPIWSKKSTKDKLMWNVKSAAIGAKMSSMLPSTKAPQQSEIITKPASRLNVHLYYPIKQRLDASPIGNSASQEDKRTVAYNTWVNSTIASGPMTKSTKRLVAKLGSPVDIKEIIEGSSVDAADYFKGMNTMHDLGVRAAKSVPSLGPHRLTGMEVVGSKRAKLSSDLRLTSHKRSRDMRLQENGSPHSLSSTEGTFSRVGGCDASISPASSTDVDNGSVLRQRKRHNRFLDQSRSLKEKKHAKKSSQAGSSKWHVLNAQDVRSVPDLTRVQYYGDMTEINALNMGLSWMVQSVFSRLPFLGQTQSSSAANAFGDMSGTQQLDD